MLKFSLAHYQPSQAAGPRRRVPMIAAASAARRASAHRISRLSRPEGSTSTDPFGADASCGGSNPTAVDGGNAQSAPPRSAAIALEASVLEGLSVEVGEDSGCSKLSPLSKHPASTQQLRNRLRNIQRQIWILLDDPQSSMSAKRLSVFIMVVIGVSVLGFTLESVPWDCDYVDKYLNFSDPITAEGSELVSADSNDRLDNFTVRARNENPQWLCKKIKVGASPYYEIEYFCVMIFSLEYIFRIASAPAGPGVWNFVWPGSKAGFMNLIDLVAIMPWYITVDRTVGTRPDPYSSSGSVKNLGVLRVIRLARVLRIFKMSKNFQGLILLLQTFQRSGPALGMLAFLVCMFLTIFATLVFYAEQGTYDEFRQQWVRDDGKPTPFESIPASMWWCIVTMTTVGYGDHLVITTPGHVIAVVTMFCGLVVLSLPVTIIGANFDELYRELQKRKRAQQFKRREEEERKRAIKREEEERKQLSSAQKRRLSGDGTPRGNSRGSFAGGKLKADSTATMKILREVIEAAQLGLFEDIDHRIDQHETQLKEKISRVLTDHAEGLSTEVMRAKYLPEHESGKSEPGSGTPSARE